MEEKSDFKMRKLLEEMQQLLIAHSEPPPPSAQITARIIEQPLGQWHKGWPNPISDPVIQQLFEQFKPLYSELMHLQANIYEVAMQGREGNTNKKLQACQMAHRILDLDDELDEIYAARDHVLETGRLPEKNNEEEIVGDPVRLATQRLNYERYVRYYRNLLEKNPGDKKAAKWAQKLKDFQQKLQRANEILKIEDE